jgi:hypothetical protein
MGQHNRFAQSSSVALLVFPKCIQLVRSNVEMPHDQKPLLAENPLLLSALSAEPRFAAIVVWSVARNHSALLPRLPFRKLLLAKTCSPSALSTQTSEA